MCMKWFGSSEKNESENYEKKYLARYKKQQSLNKKIIRQKIKKIQKQNQMKKIKLKYKKKNRTHSLQNSNLSNRNTILQ